MTDYTMVKRALQKIGFRPIHHFDEKDVLLHQRIKTPAGVCHEFIRWYGYYNFFCIYSDEPYKIFCFSFHYKSKNSDLNGMRYHVYDFENVRRIKENGIIKLKNLKIEKFEIEREDLTDSEESLFAILAGEAHEILWATPMIAREYMSYVFK